MRPSDRITVKQIASAVGVSQPAVSQALNGRGRLSPAMRERILETARKLGYRPNAAARAVALHRTRQIGVLVINSPKDPLTFPSTYYTILGMNDALESAGYVLCLIRLSDAEQAIEGQSRAFREHVLDGLIVTTSMPARIDKSIEEVVPVCVWADTNVWRPNACVRRDEYAAGTMAAEAAAAGGYRRVTFISESMNPKKALAPHFSHAERLRGARDACERRGLELTVVYQTWNWDEAFGKSIRGHLRTDTAIIATDPFRARLVAQAAVECRVTPGVDFGLTCCDNSPDVDLTWPQLARVDFDRRELGRRAANLILARLGESPDGEASQLLDCSWKPGQTLREAPH